jgi:hypothetical protein
MNRSVVMTTANVQRVEKVFVTPQLAAEWLVRNTGNRRLVNRHVESLEHVLRRGEWSLNGETIKFSNDGRLLDGQHRLHAIINTGIGFSTWVAYGVDSSAFDTIDTNLRTRTTSDVLGLHGKDNATHLAACVKLLWIFGQTGQVYDGGGGHHGFSPKECLEILSRRPGVQESVGRCHNIRVFSSPSLLAALHYLFACANSELAGEFVSVMADGSSELNRPFHILREAVINRRLIVRRMGLRQLAFMAIRAWNSEVSVNWIKKVYFKPNEEFPKIAGLDYQRLADYV